MLFFVFSPILTLVRPQIRSFNIPELPEVETVKRGLEIILGNKAKISEISILNPKLRFPVPGKLKSIAKGKEILSLSRRAKYLLFELEDYILSSHLGMTGTWRVFDNDRKKHDHIDIKLVDGRILTYHDTRKFGLFEYFKKGSAYHRFSHLGPEPLSVEFDTDYLWQKTRGKEIAIKNLIMDQKTVVGVGNIYAVESLFSSGIKPEKKSRNVTKKQIDLLVPQIKKILSEAIEAGGSTISDFKKAGGDSGYFQHQFKVYGRKGLPCVSCGKILENVVIGGRASVWCRRCQK